MLCRGDGLLGSLTALLVALLALSRSPALSCVLPAGLYLLLHLCSLEPAAPQSAQRVLKPRGAAARIAHRGGAHDAPENTLAAIRQVSAAAPSPARGPRGSRGAFGPGRVGSEAVGAHRGCGERGAAPWGGWEAGVGGRSADPGLG